MVVLEEPLPLYYHQQYNPSTFNIDYGQVYIIRSICEYLPSLVRVVGSANSPASPQVYLEGNQGSEEDSTLITFE